MRYNAFISYSHGGENPLAVALQSTVQRLANPWWQRRALDMFRDDTGLGVEPGLWPSITRALDDSEWLMLLASPGSAASIWVGREIEHWLSSRSADRILVVVAAGEYSLATSEDGFHINDDPKQAIHAQLADVSVPADNVVDLRLFLKEQEPDADSYAFRFAVAPIAGKLRGVVADEVLAEDAKLRRRTSLFVRSALVVLAALTVVSVVAGVLALSSQREAVALRDEAESQQAGAEAQARAATAEALAALAPSTAEGAGDLAVLLAAHAVALDPSERPVAVLEDLLDTDVQRFLHGGAGGYVDLDLAADVPRLAAVDGDGTVLAWDTETGELLFAIAGDAGAAAWSADGSVLLVADRRQWVRFYGPDGSSLGQPIETGHTSYRLAVTGGGPHSMTGCERASHAIPANCQLAGEVQTHVDLHPDGELFFVYDAIEDQLVVRERSTGDERGSWGVPDGLERFAADGRLLLRAEAVDLESGAVEAITPHDNFRCGTSGYYQGPQVYIPELRMWAVGAAIAVPYTEANGSEIRPMLNCFWTVDEDELIVEPAVLNIGGLRVMDGRGDGLIAVASSSTPIMLARPGDSRDHLAAEELATAACPLAGRNLTDAERERYFGSVSPSLVCTDDEGLVLGDGSPLPDEQTGEGGDEVTTPPAATEWPGPVFISDALASQGLTYSGTCGNATQNEPLFGGSASSLWCSVPARGGPDGSVLLLRLVGGSATWCARVSIESGEWTLDGLWAPASPELTSCASTGSGN